jgi:hypothetical protein
MWSGSEQPGSTKGAFRNGNYGSNNENPYINYTSYYENTLALYSSLDTLGDSVSITYSKNGSPGDYYADFGVTTATVISGVFKWIVLEIQKSASDPNKIQVIYYFFVKKVRNFQLLIRNFLEELVGKMRLENLIPH